MEITHDERAIVTALRDLRYRRKLADEKLRTDCDELYAQYVSRKISRFKLHESIGDAERRNIDTRTLAYQAFNDVLQMQVPE